MEGCFEVTTNISQWVPPFGKTQTLVEYIGNENEEFDEDKIIDENVFKINKLTGEYAIIEHNHKFVLKGSQYKASEFVLGPQTIRIPKNLELEFGFMWGNKGITKKIVYKGITGV